MRYMCLVYVDPDAPVDPSIRKQYFAFSDEVRAKGLMLAGDPLQGVETATTVRVRDGEIFTTDGPFAETKEILGGYYILDCEDLDQAIQYAAKIPGARYGSVEVRPILEISRPE